MSGLFAELKRNLWSYRWIIIGILMYYGYFAVFHTHEPYCIIKHTIGIPCPGCGMSRATWFFVTFQWREAFLYHPLVFLMPFVLVILLLRGLPSIQPLYRSKTLWIALLVLFIAVYVIRMLYYFPDTEPLDYYPQSWLYSLFQ